MISILNKKINLFYWISEQHGQNKQNYGDLLSKYIVEKVSGKEVRWVNPKKKLLFGVENRNYLAIGSIINHANKNSIVWGSGIIDFEQKVTEADFRAVRGPQTRKFLIEKGYDCPKIYGDPGLLLPNFFSPKVEKKFKLGIIPHFVDYSFVKDKIGDNEEILIIDLITNDIESTTSQILSCENIVSSSLHGIIVSHAYGIPSVWARFSNNLFGNNIKYQDYFESLNMESYEGKMFDLIDEKELISYLNKMPNLPDPLVLKEVQQNLIESCPFFQEG